MRRVVVAMGLVAGVLVTQPVSANEGATYLGGDTSLRMADTALGVPSNSGMRIANRLRLRLDPGTPAAIAGINQGVGSKDIRRRRASSMFDFYPLGNGFRVSAGARLETHVRQLTMRSASLYTPEKASKAGRSSGRVAPAMTMGYGATLAPGATIGFEAGALLGRQTPGQNLDLVVRRAMRASERFGSASQAQVSPVAQVSFGLRF